jgi:hypothetical protein
MTHQTRSFRSMNHPRGTRGPLLAAVQTALPGLAPVASEWSGNPRDFYDRPVKLRGTISGVRVDVMLGREACMDAGAPDPEVEDFGTPSVTLSGDDTRAMEALWSQLTTALAAAGYADVTR